MKNARLLFALILVGAAAACSTEATGPSAESPNHSTFMGGGNGTPPDSTTTQPADTTKKS